METKIVLQSVERRNGTRSLTLDYPTVNYERHATLHVKTDLTYLPERLKNKLRPLVDSYRPIEKLCPHLEITTSLTGTSESNYKGTMSVEDTSESTGILKAVSEYCEDAVKMNAEMRLDSVLWNHGLQGMPAESGKRIRGGDTVWFWGMEKAYVTLNPSSEKYDCKKTVMFFPRWFQEDPELTDEPYYDDDNKLGDWARYWKSPLHSYLGDINFTLILPN